MRCCKNACVIFALHPCQVAKSVLPPSVVNLTGTQLDKLNTDGRLTNEESPVTKPRITHFSWLQRTKNITQALLLPALFIFSGVTIAEPPIPADPSALAETIAVPKGSTELRIYKQSFEITAFVQCRVPKKGPSYCTVDIDSEIAYQLEPEMILKYTSIRLDEQEFATEITPQGALKFRTKKVNYSGPQTFEIVVIYLK